MDVELSGTMPQLQHAGRGDRVARTREAIVSSTLTLAMEGEVTPIVRDIAKLAGVSARTVFQHFADTAELYVAVLGRVLTSLRGDAAPPPVDGALEERISEVIGQRAGRYEKLLPMWTFVETLQHRSSEAGEQVTQMYATNREQLAECFGEELTTLPGGETRAHAQRTRHGTDAGELDRAARQARPHGRTGARGMALHRQRHFQRQVTLRRERAARALLRTGSARQLLQALVTQSEFAQMRERIAHIVDVACRSRRLPWRTCSSGLPERQLAGKLTMCLVGEIDQRRTRCGHRRDGSAGTPRHRRRHSRSRASRDSGAPRRNLRPAAGGRGRGTSLRPAGRGSGRASCGVPR